MILHVVHLEILVVHREFHKSLIENALEFTDQCEIHFRPLVHEVSAQQSGTSEIFLIKDGP